MRTFLILAALFLGSEAVATGPFKPGDSCDFVYDRLDVDKLIRESRRELGLKPSAAPQPELLLTDVVHDAPAAPAQVAKKRESAADLLGFGDEESQILSVSDSMIVSAPPAAAAAEGRTAITKFTPSEELWIRDLTAPPPHQPFKNPYSDREFTADEVGAVVNTMVLSRKYFDTMTASQLDEILKKGISLATDRVRIKPAELVKRGDTIAIKAQTALIDGRRVHYPELVFPQFRAGETSQAYLERVLGKKLQPLRGQTGKPVQGGFRSVFECPPPEPCLYKVMDQELLAKQLSQGGELAHPTREQMADLYLRSMQRELAVYDDLKRMAGEFGGTPPLMVMPEMQMVAPGTVKVWRSPHPTVAELHATKDPLLKKCASRFAQLERRLGGANISHLVAENIRSRGNVFGVVRKNKYSEPLFLVFGIDLNPSNMTVTPNCTFIPIDQ